MPNQIDLNRILQEYGLVQSSPIVTPPGEPDAVYAFIEVQRNDKNLQEPSNLQLHKIRESIAKQGICIEFVLIDASTKDAEAGVRATVLHHFGDKIRNCFMSVDGRAADVWIVPKGQIPPDVMIGAEDKIRIFLDNIGLKLRKIISTTEDNTPSKSACLSILHQASPTSLALLADQIRYRGFVIPSENWLSRTLDNLRKAGLVTRFKDGSYALTLGGIKAIGTAKNARSPDVRRILDLARRPR